ncbi:MAG TPA: sulfite exporter TauE/SafE family protein [Blastocatellia bacterium]|nr:sulfite exporter TauE/SafE family protein [Blastocatellia bacterium]
MNRCLLLTLTIYQAIVIFAAGFCAGMINSVAGGGTLISFPALIWIGRDPIVANATNTLSLWPGSLAGMLGFRRELSGSKQWIVALIVPSIAGAVAGAVLLLHTPSSTFAAIVPYLILIATLLLAVQEPITRRINSQTGGPQSRRWWIVAILFQFAVAVYGGYFGAGIGILMLAALGLMGLTDIHRMNALKNLFALCINGVAAIYFAGSGAVRWSDSVLVAAGSVAGGFGGSRLARKLGRKFVRRTIILIGLGMALSLFLRGR